MSAAAVRPAFWMILRLCVLAVVLAAVWVIDRREKRIPDRVLLPGAAAALLRFLEGVTAADFLRGLMPAVLLLVLSVLLEKLLHRRVLGGGDIKLTGMLGLHLGLEKTLLTLFLAAVFGLVEALPRKKSEREFAFGPMLAAAAAVVLLFGEKLLAG